MLVPCYSVVCQMASMLTNTVCSVFIHHQICVVGWKNILPTHVSRDVGREEMLRFPSLCWTTITTTLALTLTIVPLQQPYLHPHQQSINKQFRPALQVLCCAVKISIRPKSHPLKSWRTILKIGNLMRVLVFQTMCPYQITQLT